MKKLLLLSGLLTIALFGCKQNHVETEPENYGEIKIGSPRLLVKADAKLHDAFVNGDKIGVYSIGNKVETFADIKQSNVGYTYDDVNTAWAVESGKEPLKWQFTGTQPNVQEFPVDLVAYFPYDAALAIDADGVSVPFALSVDQSEKAAVEKSDFLWARSSGQKTDKSYEELLPNWSVIEGAGIKKSTDVGSKINLNFHHIMAAVDYKVAVTQVVSGLETFSDVKITKIEVVGADVTVSGKVNLSKGLFTETANAEGTPGSVFWAPAQGMSINLHSAGTEDKDLVYTNVACMILQPEKFTDKTGNMLKYTFTYIYDADGDATSFAPETVTKEYFYQLANIVAPGGNDNAFAANTYNNLKAVIVISSNEIRITTSITPWSVIEHDPIYPE